MVEVGIAREWMQLDILFWVVCGYVLAVVIGGLVLGFRNNHIYLFQYLVLEIVV